MYRFTHSEDRNVQEQPQKRGTSAASLVTFVLIVQTCTWGRGQTSRGRRSFLTGHPHLPHTHIHVLTLSSGAQDRLCGPAHRVLHPSALCPDEGVSDKAQTGESDPGVQRQRVCSFFSFLILPGCKTFIDTYHRAT